MTERNEPLEPSDDELLAHYRQGFREALDTLVGRHKRALYGFIANMTGGRDDADDIFQETWFRAIRNLPSYRKENFRSWLFRIGHNLMIDRIRTRRKLVSLDEPRTGDDGEGGSLADSIPAAGPGPDGEAATREWQQKVQVAVARLPAEQRAVFLMRLQDGMPFREIAQVQGVSMGTVLARMRYAVKKLRQLLGDREGISLTGQPAGGG